ncbi:MAG TPA: pentapeptide repeat-containing protein [Planctomycetota bacterium]|nr:pentapeptide repeat-containing protein [Planctomycetota bacterium]HQB00600.1 pentapeptide repeat-containing protein [Planctomycetota bacterium]
MTYKNVTNSDAVPPTDNAAFLKKYKYSPTILSDSHFTLSKSQIHNSSSRETIDILPKKDQTKIADESTSEENIPLNMEETRLDLFQPTSPSEKQSELLYPNKMNSENGENYLPLQEQNIQLSVEKMQPSAERNNQYENKTNTDELSSENVERVCPQKTINNKKEMDDQDIFHSIQQEQKTQLSVSEEKNMPLSLSEKLQQIKTLKTQKLIVTKRDLRQQFKEGFKQQFQEQPREQFQEQPRQQFQEQPRQQFQEQPRQQFQEQPRQQFQEQPRQQFQEQPRQQFREQPREQFQEQKSLQDTAKIKESEFLFQPSEHGHNDLFFEKAVPQIYSNKPETYQKIIGKNNNQQKQEQSDIDYVELLLQGKSIVRQKNDCLDLRNQVYDYPVHIVDCEIHRLFANEADFNDTVLIKNCKIKEIFLFGGDNPSIFKNNVVLQNVDIASEVNWHHAFFAKKVQINNCRFLNEWHLSDTIFESGFSIFNSQFYAIIAKGTTIEGLLSISDSKIDTICDFSKAKLNGACYITATQFTQTNFQEANFNNKIEFSNCPFEKIANFKKIQSDYSLTFIGCYFYGLTQFNESIFKNNLCIRRTEFFQDLDMAKLFVQGKIVFEKNSFGSQVDCSHGEIGNTRIDQCKFQGIVNFHETIFTGSITIYECTFYTNVRFERAIFHEKLDLQETIFEKYISFANIIGDYIRLDRKQIDGKLLAEYEKNYHQMHLEYITLQKIFQRQGQERDAYWAHCKALQSERKAQPIFTKNPLQPIKYFLNFLFLDLGCGYGTKPLNVLLFSLAIILLFGGIYFQCPPAQTIYMPKISATPSLQNIISSILISFHAFMPSGILFWKESFFQENYVNLLLQCLENLLGFYCLFLFMITFVRTKLRI